MGERRENAHAAEQKDKRTIVEKVEQELAVSMFGRRKKSKPQRGNKSNGETEALIDNKSRLGAGVVAGVIVHGIGSTSGNRERIMGRYYEVES